MSVAVGQSLPAGNAVFCEDHLRTLARLPDGSVDMVLTSPPYLDLRDYHGFRFDLPLLCEELFRVVKPGGVVVWIVGDRVRQHRCAGIPFDHRRALIDAGFGHFQTIIQAKVSMSAPRHRRYQDSVEFNWVMSKGRPATVNLIKDRPNRTAGSRRRSTAFRGRAGDIKAVKRNIVHEPFGKRWSIWSYSNAKNVGSKDPETYRHPAPFPELLALDHIRSWSRPGDLVYDPHGGSGTTGKMAALAGRRFYLSEISFEYCDTIIAPRLGRHGVPFEFHHSDPVEAARVTRDLSAG